MKFFLQNTLIFFSAAVFLTSCTDKLYVDFGTTTQTVYEDAESIKIPVKLARSSKMGYSTSYASRQSTGVEVRVPYTISGSAQNPSQHNLAAGTAVIHAGSQETEIAFTPVAGAYEIPETVVLTLEEASKAVLGSNTTHTVNILRQPIPILNFLIAAQTVVENARTVSIPFKLNAKTYHPLSVPYTVSGTAQHGSDHDLANGTLSFPSGADSANVVVNLVEDAFYEGDETLIVTMGTPTNATLGETTVHTVTIQDSKSPPVVQFNSASQTLSEMVGTVNMAVSLSEVSALATSIPYSVSGSASSLDHNLVDGTLVIPAGSASGNISFQINDDNTAEPDETVVVTLGTPTNATVGGQRTHTVTIIDDDSQPTANFTSASQSVGEAAGTASFTVRLTAISGLPVTVPYTVTGTSTSADHNLVSGSVSIPAGTLNVTTSFSIVNDTLSENDETVIITMGTPTNANLGATSVHTITILDNDALPVVSFTSSSQNVNENVGTVTVNVSLNTASGLNVTIPYTISGTATNPSDHNLTGGTFFIPAGSTTTSVTFNVVNDALYELSETVVLTMGTITNGLGLTTSHTVNILDDDTIPSVTFTSASQSVAESIGNVNVVAQLSSLSGVVTTVPYTIAGTASASDHNASSGSISIPAGSLTGTLTIAITADTLDENNETITVTMGSPTNATSGVTTLHTITILDDDPPPTIAFSASSQSVAETAGTVFVIAVLDTPSGLNVSVPFTVSGTSVNPTNHSLSNGTISITSGNTLGQQTFSIFNDGVAAANKTVILTMGAPTNATVGTTTVHTVTILDAGRAFDSSLSRLWFQSTQGVEKNALNQVSLWKNLSDPAYDLRWTKDLPKWTEKPLSYPTVNLSESFEKNKTLESATQKASQVFVVRRNEIERDKFILYEWEGSKNSGACTCRNNRHRDSIFASLPLLPFFKFESLKANKKDGLFLGEIAEALWIEKPQKKETSTQIENYFRQKYDVDIPKCSQNELF